MNFSVALPHCFRQLDQIEAWISANPVDYALQVTSTKMVFWFKDVETKMLFALRWL